VAIPKVFTGGERLFADDLNDNFQYVEGLASGEFEPAFTKNSAFNKNFGTTADTVTQGNDSRLATDRTRKITISSSAPSGGSDGDVWLRF
jgi:hypothetical protein